MNKVKRLANTVLIEKILCFIPKIRKMEKELNQKHGIEGEHSLILSSQKRLARCKEKNEAEQKLFSFLEALDKETLLDIQTIMYFSGDQNPDILSLKQHLKNSNADKEIMIDSIVEKWPALESIFSKAQDKAEKLGINLDLLK
jgi:hypothetical protein